MDAAERFNRFYEALQKSNPIWFDNLKVPFGKKDFAVAAQKTWLALHNEGKIQKDMDWQYARNLMAKILTWQEDKDQVIAPPKAEPCVIHPEALPFGPKRDEWLRKYQEAIDAMPMLKPAVKPTDEEAKEEGQVRPKAIPFVRSETEKILVAKQTVKDAQNARRKYFLDAYPDAEPEEIEAYVRQFKSVDDPDNLCL